MRQVEQRKIWTPEEPWGDCGRACVASIFEVPYEETEGIDGTSRSIREWMKPRYPGVTIGCRALYPLGEEEKLGDHVKWPQHHWEQGYWLATVWSPRIPGRELFGCGCAWDGSNPKDPDPDCQWCHGKPHERSLGINWGLHLVVMHNRDVAWDPHPERPTTPLYFYEATTFVVTDPARLVPDPHGAGAPLAFR